MPTLKKSLTRLAPSHNTRDDHKKSSQTIYSNLNLHIILLRLSINAYNDKYFTKPLPIPYLKELAAQKNQALIPPPPAASSNEIVCWTSIIGLDVDFPSTDQYAMQNEYHIDSEELRVALANKNKPATNPPI